MFLQAYQDYLGEIRSDQKDEAAADDDECKYHTIILLFLIRQGTFSSIVVDGQGFENIVHPRHKSICEYQLSQES